MRRSVAADIFRVEPMTGAGAVGAYPLVRMWDPHRSQAAWRALASHYCGRRAGRGMMAVRDRRGVIHGLFTYHVQRTLRHGTVLRLNDVIVAQMPGPSLADIVVDGADALRRDLGCDALVIDLPVSHGGLPPSAPGSHPSRFKADTISFRAEPD